MQGIWDAFYNNPYYSFFFGHTCWHVFVTPLTRILLGVKLPYDTSCPSVGKFPESAGRQLSMHLSENLFICGTLPSLSLFKTNRKTLKAYMGKLDSLFYFPYRILENYEVCMCAWIKGIRVVISSQPRPSLSPTKSWPGLHLKEHFLTLFIRI